MFVFTVHNKHSNVIVPSYDISLTIVPFPITKDPTTTGGINGFLHRPFILTRSLWHESRSHIQIPAFCSKRLPWLFASVAANTRNKSAHHKLPLINRAEFSKNSLIPCKMASYAGQTLRMCMSFSYGTGTQCRTEIMWVTNFTFCVSYYAFFGSRGFP